MVRLELLLKRAHGALCDLRDALATVWAHSAVGEGESLVQASEGLQAAVNRANLDCRDVLRLLRHLGVQSMPEAASKLCTDGRPDAAKLMMDIHGLIVALASSQADVSAFLDECLDSLEATQHAAIRQVRGGRLLGSA
ncbi:MAG TPA: hypothetical protein VFA48_11910 [Gammaproteobacteria bacterium]|nr:hypothetical protein [Gammaproteobacteria bacterium]